MPTRPDAQPPREPDARLFLLLLGIAVMLIVVGGAMYLSHQHPQLVDPLLVGSAVAAVLVAVVAIIIKGGPGRG
ncbi:hypothetical protein ACTVZO_42385 [Streptomyces sp. IBSNAI002]|uniref:hypothetical protein n=1 Tax=Streptomyces sp. IBSNAI002 TaxID=3457500 RepID=UPI003FD56F80